MAKSTLGLSDLFDQEREQKKRDEAAAILTGRVRIPEALLKKAASAA